jgi:hypothetical protein
LRVVVVEPVLLPADWRAEPELSTSPATARGRLAVAGHIVVDATGSDTALDLQLRRGDAAEHLLRASRDAALLVLGSRGHLGRLGAVLGSVSRACVRDAVVPVVLLGPHAGDTPDVRVVVPSPRGPQPGPAVAWAVQRALTQGRDLLLLDRWSVAPHADADREQVHAAALQRHQAMLDAVRRAVSGRVGVTGDLVEGAAPDVELDLTGQSDLLVVAREDREHGPSFVQEQCPVVLMPSRPSRGRSGQKMASG